MTRDRVASSRLMSGWFDGGGCAVAPRSVAVKTIATKKKRRIMDNPPFKDLGMIDAKCDGPCRPWHEPGGQPEEDRRCGPRVPRPPHAGPVPRCSGCKAAGNLWPAARCGPGSWDH